MAAVLHVDVNSVAPAPPYTNWATAAVSIQEAVDAAVTGDIIIVTNGTYAIGERAVGLSGSNRVAVEKGVTLQSVNGPQFTIIDGGGTVRCAYLNEGAAMSGFTLTHGQAQVDGGGVWCPSTNGFLSNCVIVANRAAYGGGAAQAILHKCVVANNQASGYGGGVYYGCTLYDCTLTGNSAGQFAGGACNSTLYNCTLTNNGAKYDGGGALSCSLYNCTVTRNTTRPDYFLNRGGGVKKSKLYNCIVYLNWARTEENYDSTSTLSYCCTTPLPATGIGNITNAPLFVDEPTGNLRLQPHSPCINAGTNAYATTASDIDGRPRIVGGTVDMGAYEFQPSVDGAFICWLEQHGQPTDGSADHADPDHDGMDNWQEWVCATDPANALSALRLISALPSSSTVTVTWQSQPGVSYFLESTADLTTSFRLMATNVLGGAGTTSYTDTYTTGTGPSFYRVGVSRP